MEKEFVLPEIKISLTFDKKVKKSELITVRNAEGISQLLRRIYDADTFDWKEEFIMLCLNKANKIVGFYKVSSGGLSGTIADPKIIFTVALNCGASAILLSHNHPSGNLTPSTADIAMTKKIKEAGAVLDIDVLDHIIVTDEGFLSLREEGLF